MRACRPGCVRSTDAGSATWYSTSFVRGEADRLSRRRAAVTLGAGVAAMVLVAGTIVALVAPQVVVGTTPTVADSSCQDTWTGAAGTTDWNTATNWSTGIPNSTSVHACITGHATVLLTGASLSVGQLTVSAGSSLTIGAGATGPTAATLHVSSGMENDGTLSVAPGTDGGALTLDGTVTNTGNLTVGGTVIVGGDRHRRPSPMTASSGSHRVACSPSARRRPSRTSPTGCWPSASTGRPTVDV